MATGEGVEDETIIEIIAHELRYNFVNIFFQVLHLPHQPIMSIKETFAI